MMAEQDKYAAIVRSWRRRQIRTAADLAAETSGYLVQFAYHSGKIENENITYYDTREIFDHDGVTSYTGDLRTLYEIKNAKDASDFLLEAFEARLPIDLPFVLRLQKLLTKNTYDTRRWQAGERPGTLKRHDYVTGRGEVGAAAEESEKELSELLAEIADFSSEDAEKILTAAAYFHAKFENIHPFADGNGRTGRLAMNYFLLLHDHPPIVIHEEDRKLYYRSLEAFDTLQTIAPLVLFLKAELLRTWDTPRFLRQ